MKVKFLRDYHGPETNEYRHLQGAIVEFHDAVAENFIARKIVVSVEPIEFIGNLKFADDPVDEPEIEVTEIEITAPVIEAVKPVKIVTKRKPKKK